MQNGPFQKQNYDVVGLWLSAQSLVWNMVVELQARRLPGPIRSDCVSALVSMKPRDVFAETSGQFPVMFVSNRDIIFSEVPLSPNPTRPEAQRWNIKVQHEDV